MPDTPTPGPPPGDAGPPAGRRIVAIQVGQFALAGLVALAVVAVATAVASRRVGEREAISEARITTVIRAQGVVTPALSDALLAGDAEAVRRVDEVVRRDVIDDSLVRVKLWSAAGQVVYSDERALIGATYELAADEKEALATGRIEAEVSDLDEPENRFERSYGKLLEIYLPVRTPSNQVLLFEAYYRYGLVSASGNRLWRSFAPISLGALVMLELVQLPFAWSLARRLRQRSQEREALLERAVEASDAERRRIAADLHDGVVQDLTGVAFALSAAIRREDSTADAARVIAESAESVRGSIRSLRTLLVDIYPPDFDEVTLESALADLLTRASDSGVETSLDASGLRDPVPGNVARLLYRAAQEGVRNVVDHAGARHLTITVVAVGRAATVEVADDGRGVDPAQVAERQAAGHLGLTLLRGLLADAGGSLEMAAPPGGRGTVLRATVPFA